MNLRSQTGIRKPAAVYVATIVSISAGLLLWEWARAELSVAAPSLVSLAFWLFLSLASECFWLETPTGDGMISMSLAVNLATLFVLPPPLVLTIGAISVGMSDLLLHGRGWLRASFNAAQTSLSLAATLLVTRWLAPGAHSEGSQFLLREPLATLSAPAVFFLANTALVSGIISLHGRISFRRAWRENFGFRDHILSSVALFFLGAMLVVAVETVGYVSGLVCLVFFHLIRGAYKRIQQDRAAGVI